MNSNNALRLIFKVFTPWKKDKLSKEVARYLDGEDSAMSEQAALKALLDEVIQSIEDDGLESDADR